jgi:hypothetical protein
MLLSGFTKEVLYKLFLEYTIPSGLHDTASIANSFCNTAEYQAASKGAPNSISNCQVELDDGKDGKDGEIKGVGAEVGNIMIPAVYLDATSSHGTKTAIERHVGSREEGIGKTSVRYGWMRFMFEIERGLGF